MTRSEQETIQAEMKLLAGMVGVSVPDTAFCVGAAAAPYEITARWTVEADDRPHGIHGGPEDAVALRLASMEPPWVGAYHVTSRRRDSSVCIGWSR